MLDYASTPPQKRTVLGPHSPEGRSRVFRELRGVGQEVWIPKAFAADIGIEENSPIEISLADGDLVLSPPRRTTFTLEGLLSGVTKENLHREVETGPAVGNEVW